MENNFKYCINDCINLIFEVEFSSQILLMTKFVVCMNQSRTHFSNIKIRSATVLKNTLMIQLVAIQRFRHLNGDVLHVCQIWCARIGRGMTPCLWRYHPHTSFIFKRQVVGSYYSHDGDRFQSDRASPGRRAHATCLQLIYTRDTVLYCTYRLGRHIDFQFPSM